MSRDDYEERQARRRERLEARAERARKESNDAYDEASRIAKQRPLGQPILVGHHSERSARADQNRIERNMQKSVEKSREAAELARKAKAVGKGSISSDDPNAVSALQRKLEALERNHAERKRINGVWRKAGKPAPDDADAWSPIQEELNLSPAGLHQLRLQMAERRRWDPSSPPFQGYVLTNTTAEIRRLKKRIADLQLAHEQTESLEEVE